ncbi:kelch-like protein 40b isoform X1 [Daphnia pulicaria]|uniref:kelch-like protein 40b isoform X1 n=1 Tax=Daphnia pulicaria TaxID=35523 RepID=UPI001EEA53FE|nr:kelch-like protein 40b isoform X1 [Daphnia pulicaria]
MTDSQTQQIELSSDISTNDNGTSTKKVTGTAPDVVLLCEGERISCHRAVLAKASSYFSAMFSSSFAEKDERSITIKDVDGFMLRVLVDLSYGYPLQLEDEKRMLKLLETASMLQFLEVQTMCVQFLLHTLNESNALEFFALGDMIGVPELSKQSFAYLLYNFDSIVESRELLSQLHIDLLLKLLEHPNLNCNVEIQILEIVDRWIIDQSDIIPEDRVFKLFSCTRFRVLTEDDLKKIALLPFVQESKMLSRLVSILSLKLDATLPNPCRCHCHIEGSSPLPKLEGCQACSGFQVAVADEVDSDQDAQEENSCLSTPDFEKFRLREIFRSPCCSKKSESSIDSSEKKGEVSDCYPQEILDLVEQLLATSPRVPPFVPSVVGHVRRIEVPTDGPSLKKSKHIEGPSLLMYNFKSKSFNSLVKLSKIHEGPVEASGYKVCTLGKDIFIFGGEYMFGYSNWQNSVWRWDSFKNIWNIETSLLSSRRHHSLCVYEEFIYLIGGYGKHRIILDSVDRYDTFKCSWKRCAPLPSPLYSAACCSHKGIIYVFSHQVFSYDQQSDEWHTLANVRLPADTTFSQAMSVKDSGIYLTSVYSNFLYHFDPDAESLAVGVVGKFENNVLNSCYVESLQSIFTFSTGEVSESAGFPPSHQVEIFDLASKSFTVLWKQTSDEGLITDFGIRHSLGCFPFLCYE